MKILSMIYEISNVTLLEVMPIIPYISVLGTSLLRYPMILVSMPVPRRQRLVILILTIPTVDKDPQLKFPKSRDFPVFLIAAENTPVSFWNSLMLTNKTSH